VLREALLVGGVRLERYVFRLVLVVPANDIDLVLVDIFEGPWFDKRGFVAALQHLWIISVLNYLRGC